MKTRFITLVLGSILALCAIANAGWTDGEKVDMGTTGQYNARQEESTWDMCVDDSNIIQIVWENAPGQGTEVYYRDKPLRAASWRDTVNVTGADGSSGGPGHASITTYKYVVDNDSIYKTVVGYISQSWGANEYKRRDFNRRTGEWDQVFSFISPDDDAYRMPSGPTGGSKTGNMISCGSDTVFFAWPYLISIGGADYSNLYYRTKTGANWSTPASILGATTDSSRDVCPYPMPNHSVALVYARSGDNSTINTYYIKYEFGSGFSTAGALTDVASGVEATMPYVVSRDKENGLFTLHFVWEEKYGSNYRVLYQRYDSTSSSGNWLSHPDTLERTDGRQPSVAVTPDGDVYVVYNDVNGDHIYYKYAAAPSFSWGSRTEITDDEATSLRWPLVVADKIGNMHLEANGCLSGNWHTYYFFLDLAPLTPQNMAKINDEKHPKFKWSPCKEPNFKRYKIYRKYEYPYFVLLASVTDKNDTIYTDWSLDLRFFTPGTWAHYYVQAEDSLSQVSPASSTVSFWVDPAPKLMAEVLPSEISLSQNYPNPFNPETKIEYALPEPSHVRLDVFDMLGRIVAILVDEKQEPGAHRVAWNAGDIPSGIYFYRIKAGDKVEIKKMVLMK